MAWYLMSAKALTEKNRSRLSEVPKHWQKSTVYVTVSGANKIRFCCSCGDLNGCDVDSVHTWINDTGNGYRNVPYDDREIVVKNIVRFDAEGNMTAENKFGLNISAPIYVFK